MQYETFPATKVTDAIDKFYYDNQEDGRRNHLGGSLIGRPCDRELWFTHRWATDTKHEGRICRLFLRGHREEFQFVQYLQEIGATVEEYDPTTLNLPKPKQYRMSSVGGHFGGSLDGKGWNVPGVEDFNLAPDTKILLEFKTHGETSFKALLSKGLSVAKLEHYVQMQVYMRSHKLPLGLYMAVNKNTDKLENIFVPYNATVAESYAARGERIVTTPRHPQRAGRSPSDVMCRFCDHKPTCWKGRPMAVNCRTCSLSETRPDGTWFCNRWSATIPLDAQKVGCDHYNAIKD